MSPGSLTNRDDIMKDRSSSRMARALGVTALAMVLGSAAALSSATIAHADSGISVFPSDLGSTNFTSAAFDGMATTPFTALPANGSKWVLDVEDKPQGTSAMVGDGLQLSGSAAGNTKIRYQYYVGSGGYPAIDAQAGADGIPLSQFVQGLSWSIRYPSGPPAAGHGGATIEFRMEKKISDGVYHQASGYVQCPSTPTTTFETQDLSQCDWRVNSRYLNGTTYTPGQWDYFLPGNGGLAQFLSDFDGYHLVSFGPNSGRSAFEDGTYIVRSITALGSTFDFLPTEQSPVTAPVADADALPAYLDSKGVTPVDVPGTVDPSAPYEQSVAWTGADSWVDVYGYSTPVFLGTFPVVDGVAQLDGVDLSSFSSGTHHLVLIGQSSGNVAAYSMLVAASAAAAAAPAAAAQASLASTGADATIPVAVASGLLLLGILLAALGLLVRRSRVRRR
jgi:hypothetical protein